MSLDILFLSKNRLEFTKASLAALMANTNWDLVRYLWLCDDNSTDGTQDLMAGITGDYVRRLPKGNYGAPAEVMKAFINREDAPNMFFKLDNDCILPPGYLDTCAGVMERHPELDLLGVEPPASRTPHHACQAQPMPIPEQVGPFFRQEALAGYARARSIGGIGLMRTKAFRENAALEPHSIYGGFTDWQYKHPKLVIGWMVPPIRCFLLDRMCVAPWKDLSRDYIAKGWQRAWSTYPMKAKDDLWGWWDYAETPCLTASR